jgi:parallel beta-helix repeat protein
MTSPFLHQFHPRTPIGRAAALAIALIGLMSVLAMIHAQPARAAEPCIGPDCDSVAFVDSGARFALYSDADPGSGVHRMYFGNPGDEPLMGDWNCDGETTPAMYRRSTGWMYLRNTNTEGPADKQYYFGSPGDIPIAGDFNGDGCDTVSIYRPSEQRFYITNTSGGGIAEYSFTFGNPGDRPFVGDFDGDGTDTVGLHRQSTGRVYLTNNPMGKNASAEFVFGDPGDTVLAGDWNGDGRDTVGVYRASNGYVYLKHVNAPGAADVSFKVGSFTHAMPTTGVPSYAKDKGIDLTKFTVDVNVYPGDDLARVARDHPARTVFMIHGTHYRQSVQPKDGQVFLGAAGAKLDGGDATQYAFHGSANDVVIRGLEIAYYAAPPHFGAVYVSGSRWIVANNEIHHTRGEGVAVRDDLWTRSNPAAVPRDNVIRDNHIHHNHHLGIAVRGTVGTIIEGNEISYNNWLGEYDGGWEAGGTKFWETEGLIARNNYSHHNVGPGLWSDHDNNNTLYEGNTIEDNTGPGIFHEISYSAVIRNNTIRRNGLSQSVWLWGAGILIAASPDIEVYGNLVEGNGNGISLIQQNRGSGNRGPWVVKNVNVYNNTVTGGKSGAVQDMGDNSIFSTNSFRDNTYRGNVGWAWNNNNEMGWSSWQATGNDTNGRYIR